MGGGACISLAASSVQGELCRWSPRWWLLSQVTGKQQRSRCEQQGPVCCVCLQQMGRSWEKQGIVRTLIVHHGLRADELCSPRIRPCWKEMTFASNLLGGTDWWNPQTGKKWSYLGPLSIVKSCSLCSSSRKVISAWRGRNEESHLMHACYITLCDKWHWW